MSRIVRWMFVLLVVLATSAGAQVRQLLPDDTARLWLEAVNLLQDQDTMPFLDTARVRLVAGALQTIRRQFPQLADILGSGMLCLYFRLPVDVSVVARSYSRVPEVNYAGQQVYAGDGSRITLIPKGRRLHFVFARGGGDCPSGCTEWDFYYVTYDTLARSVTLERQTPHGGKREE